MGRRGRAGDRGQASNVPAIAAGTIGTLALRGEDGDPRLELAELAVGGPRPFGEEGHDPARRSRRSVSFRPWAPIPSRWIGKPPTDRMKGPSGQKKRVERAT